MWKAFMYHGTEVTGQLPKLCVPGIELRSSGMVTSAFAHGANLASPELPLFFLRCIIFILCVRMFCWQV